MRLVYLPSSLKGCLLSVYSFLGIRITPPDNSSNTGTCPLEDSAL